MSLKEQMTYRWDQVTIMLYFSRFQPLRWLGALLVWFSGNDPDSMSSEPGTPGETP